MKLFVILFVGILLRSQSSCSKAASMEDAAVGISVHFGFRTENGQYRSEDIKFNQTAKQSEKGEGTTKSEPVEYRGDYSFISDDGYEYTVKYRADKNGFQPRVTARKITREQESKLP